MEKLLHEKYSKSGVFDYEKCVELRKQSSELMSATANLAAGINGLSIPDEAHEAIGDALINAVNQLSRLNGILSAKVAEHRKEFSK